MERKICMFTGHRYIEPERIVLLPRELDELLERLIGEGYLDFRCGGAQGFDTIAALKVLEKKKIYPDVKLHLFLPCREQTRGVIVRWSTAVTSALPIVPPPTAAPPIPSSTPASKALR